MKSQDPLEQLMDLVEERQVIRGRLPELDTEIRRLILILNEAGTSVETLAQIVGVSKNRVYDIIAVFSR